MNLQSFDFLLAQQICKTRTKPEWASDAKKIDSASDDESKRPGQQEISPPCFEEYLESSKWFEESVHKDVLIDERRTQATPIDVEENSNEFLLCTELSGFKKEDIYIECQGNELHIFVELKPKGRPDESQLCRHKKSYGLYKRSFILPPEILTDQIIASCDDGFLKVLLPKQKKIRARRIEIDTET